LQAVFVALLQGKPFPAGSTPAGPGDSIEQSLIQQRPSLSIIRFTLVFLS
jgi:hypothetical protein